MSTKPNAPKAPKKAAPKAAKPRKTSPGELFHGPQPQSSVIDHPNLAHIPTLLNAYAMAPESEEGRDWLRLCGSLERVGQIEAVKAVRLPDGKWGVVDGRSRRAGMHVRRPDVPIIVEEVTEQQAAAIVAESLNRRNIPRFVIAYLACLEHADELMNRKQGRPRKGALDEDAMTQAKLAERCEVSISVIVDCLAALRHFAVHPEDRESDEPKIIAGLMSPERVIHAHTGRAATKGEQRRPSSLESWMPKLKSLTSTCRDFDKWSDKAREKAAEALTAEAAKWPDSFRAIVIEALAASAE